MACGRQRSQHGNLRCVAWRTPLSCSVEFLISCRTCCAMRARLEHVFLGVYVAELLMRLFVDWKRAMWDNWVRFVPRQT